MVKRIFTVTLLILGMGVQGMAQHKIEWAYFNDQDEPVDSATATRVTVTTYADPDNDQAKVVSRTKSGQLRFVEEYSDLEKGILDGQCFRYHNNGALKRKIFYKEGQIHDTLTSYFPTGQLKRKDVFESGKLISGRCYTSTGADTAHFDFMIMPVYPGGEAALFKYISSNVKYPKLARKAEIEGTVYVQFTVNSLGQVIDAHLLRSVHDTLDEEALRVVNNMNEPWTPGYEDGEAVSVTYNLPIKFTLR